MLFFIVVVAACCNGVAALETYPSNKFLQFAERYLCKGKSDPSHNTALKSCLLRIPGTVNSKYRDMGIDPEVNIIQKWDGRRPDYKLLIGRFHAYLVQEVIDEKKMEELKRSQRSKYYSSTTTAAPTTIRWIEKLLQTPIPDYRKHARDLIIIPYLVVCKQLTDRNQIYDIVMNWSDKCGQLKRLDPSRHEFSIRVRRRIDEVMKDRIPPMTFETLKEKCPELYERLKLCGGD